MKYVNLLLTAMAFALATPAAAKNVAGQYILFAEQEASTPPIRTRILVSDNYVRFDDGEGLRDYLIFDRKAGILYNVRHDNRSVMILRRKDVQIEPPFELKHTVRDLGVMEEAPTINDQKPVHHQYLTNGEMCVDVVSIKGLMPEAVQALKEFQQVLASDSKMTFNNIPADLHKPCSIAMSTFAPARHLSNGFPIQESKPGYTRSLIDFKQNFTIDASLFEVPEEYFRFSVQQMREGRVNFENEQIIEARPDAPGGANQD